MNDLNLFLESAKDILKDPSFQVFSSPEWGSSHPDHRTPIHAKVAELKEASPRIHTSISHAFDMGIIGASKFPIGVDVEQGHRVLDKIVERVSSFNELPLAPTAAALWCAKEACFKALKSFRQPPVISRISIGDWHPAGKDAFTCRLMNPADFNAPTTNLCVVLQTYEHTYAFFILRPA